jgi:hypothetical protein
MDDHVADGWIWLSVIMSPSELLRELHESNQALALILERLRLIELRNWTLSDALEAERKLLELEDEKDRAEERQGLTR